eukprot:735764-Rhodomonas_salina.2
MSRSEGFEEGLGRRGECSSTAGHVWLQHDGPSARTVAHGRDGLQSDGPRAQMRRVIRGS